MGSKSEVQAVLAMCKSGLGPLLNARQSVGYANAIQAILLATYRALVQLPPRYLPSGFTLPALPKLTARPLSSSPSRAPPHLGGLNIEGLVTAPPSRQSSRPPSPTSNASLPPIDRSHELFQYVWCGLAGISTPDDVDAFQSLVVEGLGAARERVKITNGESSDSMYADGLQM